LSHGDIGHGHAAKKKQSTSGQNKKISQQFKGIVYDDIQLKMLVVLYHHFTISI